MRFLLPILILCSLATGSLLASGVWDFHAGAGINAGRADNPGFVGTENPSYDPNAPQCDPNSANPNPNASVCQKRISATRRRSDINGSLRLSGAVSGQWAATRFDLAYSPFVSYYYDQSELSQVSHNLNSNWSHNYTARSSITINAIANYTPEQDVDPNATSTNRVYVNQTDQLSGGLRAGYSYAVSPKTTISGTYRYVVRAYGSDDYVDSTTHNAGVNWRRRVTARSFIQTGYEYGRFLYGDGPPLPASQDPNMPADPDAVRGRDFDSSHHQASVGYGVEFGRGFRLTANAGYNVLHPMDSHLDDSSGLYASSEADWTGTKLFASAGYLHSLSGGSGSFTNAKADNLRANLRYVFTQKISSDMSLARNVNERVAAGSSQQSETVRTTYARASVNWTFAQDWSASASFTRFTQDQSGQSSQSPEIHSNRWSAGLAWSLR